MITVTKPRDKEPRMSEKQVVVRQGVGFLPLLALLFIGLKLGGVIGWSWWWVLAPLWAPVAIFLSVLLIFVAIVAVIALVAGLFGVAAGIWVKVMK